MKMSELNRNKLYLSETPNKTPSIRIKLSIYGNGFDPDEITKATKIIPTTVWRKGDQVNSITVHKEDSWHYSTEEIETYEDDDLWEDIFKLFNPVRNIFKSFKEQYNLTMTFYVIVDMPHPETPSLCLDNKILNLLSSMGAHVSYDLYFTGECEYDTHWE